MDITGTNQNEIVMCISRVNDWKLINISELAPRREINVEAISKNEVISIEFFSNVVQHE